MQEKESSGSMENCSPENKDSKAAKPLSETIPNAHAAGDGAMGRSDESAIKPDEENKNRSDECIKKDAEPY